MSCISPGTQASRASGPVPRPQNRASASSLPRMRLLAKCSWLILDLAPLPAVADLLQDGQHHLAQRFLEAERSKALVEHRVCGGARRSGRSPQAGERRGSSSIPSDGRSSSSAARAASAAERPCSSPRRIRSHASGVGRCVEPEAARRANRPREPVPRLPRARSSSGVTPRPCRTRRSEAAQSPSAMDIIIQTFNKHLTGTDSVRLSLHRIYTKTLQERPLGGSNVNQKGTKEDAAQHR